MYPRQKLRHFLVDAVRAALVAVMVVACGQGASPSPTPPPSPPPGDSPTAPGGSPGESPTAVRTVVVDGIAFGQSSIAVAPGSVVRWQNDDVVAHTVTHGSDGSAEADPLFDLPLPTGEGVEHAFDEAGTYSVTCTIHPQMNMTVEVE